MIPAIGWMSAALFLVAYALLSRGKLQAQSRWYHGLNVAAAVGLAISNGSHGALPSTSLNVVWVVVGLYALVTGCRRI